MKEKNNEPARFKRVFNACRYAVVILAFVVAGNTLAWASGVTNAVSRIFYWPEEQGSVAGESTVRMAQTKTHPFVIADQADFDVIKQRIQNNEQPWRAQYDKLMGLANGMGDAPSGGYWTSADCSDFNTRKNKGDGGGRALATINLACVLSGDAEICRKAKSHVLGWATQTNLDVILCGNDQNAIHSVNSVILNEALGYDWLYPGLSDSERSQVSSWLSQAGGHLRTVHGRSNRCHNKEAWDDATLTMAGIAIGDNDMANYALGIGSYATSHQSIKNLIGCAIHTNGNVCDSHYGCAGAYGSNQNDYQYHGMLLWEAIVLSSAAGAENGYENFFQTQSRLNTSFDFYAALFQTNNADNLDYAGFDFIQPAQIGDWSWLSFTGIYEMGYKYLPSNTNIKNTLQDQDFNYYGSPTCSDCPAAPEYNRGIPRFCNQSNCSRWLKYPNLIFGQAMSSAPPPNCSACGAWQNAGACGTGGCGATQKPQTRSGCPTGCQTSKCEDDTSCGGVTVCGDNICDPGEINSCPNDCTGGGQTEIIKVDTGAKNPAVAVDSIGNLHFAYDCHTYVHSKGIGAHNACYRKVYSENGEIKMTVPQTLLTEGSVVLTADPRIAMDQGDRAHIIANSTYLVITPTGQTLKKELVEIDNARLAVSRTSNESYLLYRAGRYGGIMLKKLIIDDTGITEAWTKTVNSACSKPQMPGNVVIDKRGAGNVTWRQFGDDDLICPGRNVQYAQFNVQSGDIYSQRDIEIGSTSDFTDMFYDAAKDEFHFIVTNPYGQGLNYKIMSASGTMSPVYGLYLPPNPVVFQASERFGEGNTVGPYLSMDKSGKLYMSFTGASTQLMPNSSIYYYTAYYTILDRAQLQADVNNAPALTRFTPDHWSDQGTAGSNPIIGPAWNQGVFFAYEDDIENSLFDIYLKAAGGAVIGPDPPLPPGLCDPNLDCDSVSRVDVFDLALLMYYWDGNDVTVTPNIACDNGLTRNADFNADKRVDAGDLGWVATCWGSPMLPSCVDHCPTSSLTKGASSASPSAPSVY